MRLLAKSKVKRIQFCESRAHHWVERAAELGIDPELAAKLAEETAAARAAYKRQQAAQQTARAATIALNEAVRKMSESASSTILMVRSRAPAIGPEIYSKALIPPPRKKSPLGPPGAPTRFRVKLTGIGGLILSWDCRNPRGSQGTQYYLWRKLGQSPKTFLGIAGKKTFTDQSIPPGTAQVTYEIQAARSTIKGDPVQHTIHLGTPKGMPTRVAIKRQYPALVG